MAVKVKIGGDSTGAEKALKDTRTGMKGLANDGKKSGDSVAVGFIKAQVALAGAQVAARALAAAFQSVAVGAISVGADMESFEVQLETLLGSSDAAAERIQTLFEIGSSTPFQLDQLVAAEVKLEAFGVTGDRARTAVMDLAAFMGGDLIGAADAVGRAFQGGAGAADILRDKGVLAMVEMQAGIKPTELSLEEFRETLIDTLTDPNGKIAGGTAKLAETFRGLVSNLGDEWFKFQRLLADAGAFDAAKIVLEDMLDLIDDNRSATADWSKIIGDGIAGGIFFAYEATGLLGQSLLAVGATLVDIVEVIAEVSSRTALWGEAREFWDGLIPALADSKEMMIDMGGVFAEIPGRVDAARVRLDGLSGSAEKTERSTSNIRTDLEGSAAAVDDIAGSPLFSESDIKKITTQIEKMAGVFDEEAAFAEETKELQAQINQMVASEMLLKEDAVRLEALLVIAGLDRLGVEEDITAEKRAQLEADEKLTAQMAAGSAVASGISGGPEALLTSGAGMAGVWGAIIMAALQGGQRNAEGEFEMVAQNEQFQALVENFADGIGDLIVDLTRQVPKHLADAFKTAPELAENLMEGINEAAPELAPALIRALVEGMSDPQRGIELAQMLIHSLIQAGEEIPAALAFMVADWAVETVERIIDVWNGGLEELGDNIEDFFIDILERLTGMDLDNSDSPGASGKSRDDDSGNRAGRTVAGSAGSDSDSGLTVVNVSLSADAEQLGLGLLVESNAALRRNMLTPYSVPTSIVTQKTDPTGALP